jgi:hypothetical protein
VAALTSIIVAPGPVHLVAGHPAANLTAYLAAFLAAAAICLCGVAFSLSNRDAAAATIPAASRVASSRRPSPGPPDPPAACRSPAGG